MIYFENTEVFNIDGALRGMRNSWESWGKSDSGWKPATPDDRECRWVVGPADHKLAMRLSNAGPGHDKFLRQILISADITAPEYWWKETDTYHFFEANSTSMMHRLGAEEICETAFSFDDPTHPLVLEYLDLLSRARDEWITAGKKKPSPEWRLMNQLTAISFNYRRTFTSNYAQLKSMYFQRKNHRLEEWSAFRDWVERLPYSEFITGKEGESK